WLTNGIVERGGARFLTGRLADRIGGHIMRLSQIVIFILGAVSLIASAFGIGKDYGETFYNAGIALLLLDVVYILLWPSAKHS
ncbi:MAG: hypothetical protein LUO98_01745, partial [Methanoregula sp.]|nr:hypothetical protein [Methanoregula sp.]